MINNRNVEAWFDSISKAAHRGEMAAYRNQVVEVQDIVDFIKKFLGFIDNEIGQKSPDLIETLHTVIDTRKDTTGR